MADTPHRPAGEYAADNDLRTREIAQDAQTDTELESMVPPRSSGRSWRVMMAAAASAAVIIILLIALI